MWKIYLLAAYPGIILMFCGAGAWIADRLEGRMGSAPSRKWYANRGRSV